MNTTLYSLSRLIFAQANQVFLMDFKCATNVILLTPLFPFQCGLEGHGLHCFCATTASSSASALAKGNKVLCERVKRATKTM